MCVLEKRSRKWVVLPRREERTHPPLQAWRRLPPPGPNSGITIFPPNPSAYYLTQPFHSFTMRNAEWGLELESRGRTLSFQFTFGGILKQCTIVLFKDDAAINHHLSLGVGVHLQHKRGIKPFLPICLFPLRSA